MKRDVGFSVRVFVACALVFAGTLSFSGCQNDLLESPSFQNRGSYSTGRVAAPTNVTATQGGFRSITLKWTAAKSAVLYNIYSSDTATGNFEFLEQTPDATCSYTLSESPDVKKYYKIKSVDSNGEVSELYSQICFGTTLATPIITSIKQNANGDEITVRWYKGVNCTTDTYLNSGLIYTVVLYNADGTQVIKEETISAMDVKEAADTKYTFKNLTPNTEYCIQIKAYTKAAQDSKSTENSDILNQSTAHSLIPAAPENFAVSKGTSKDQVTLSWTLPKFAEIKSSTAFETRPVYFKIYRKLESAPENAYEPIVSYLGTKAPTINEKDVEGNSKIEKTAIQFTRPTDTEGNKTTEIKIGESLDASKAKDESGKEIEIPAKVEVSVEYPTEETETDPNYPNYIPGTKITLSDKTVSRGQKYSYRVQSFIDDNGKKNVTSDESYSEDIGWLINSPTVSVSSTYKENEKDNNLIDSFTVTLNFKFDDFDQPYNYVITETCQKMIKARAEEIEEGKQDYPDPESPATETHPNSTSYSNFFPWVHTYEPLNDSNAYLLYTYDVAVCPKDSKNDDSNYYIKVSAPGSVIVINDKSMIPDVSSFKVVDGYKDYFKLIWDYDKNCKYKISWKNIDKTGNETYEEYEFQESDFMDKNAPIENTKGFSYKHKADSGDIRKEYTLYADNGLKNYQTAKDENENMEFKTLGTPEPYFEPSYNSIKVIWQAVQKADGDKYVAEYKFEGNEKITLSSESENIKTDDGGKTFYCEITKPYGEKTEDETTVDNTTDASIAGKDIEFVLTAHSNVDQCDTTIPISTLGPANLDLKVSGDRKTITVEWNKVEGAKGYLIFRKKYIHDYFSDQNDKGDLYYYEPNSENGTLSLIGSDVNTPSKCVPNTSKTFKFTDIYQSITAESDYQDQYKTDQAQLAWGLPYGYTVIPVLSSSDFEFDDNYAIQGTSSSIAYTADSLKNVEQKGATYGYGLAIEASKATTNKNVKVSWKTPYNATKTPILLYRRYNEKDGSEWTQYEDYNGKNTDSNAECPPKESCKAYDYLVYYNFDGNLEIDPYYEHFLSQRTDSDNEKENKGYILSFETPQAIYAGANADSKSDPNYYAEKFTWRTANFTIYDTNERKKKPDSIKIRMLNTNKTVGWQEVAEINPETFRATANTESCQTYDLDIDTTTNDFSITVAPDGIKNKGATNTNGLLKVLRDAKHYYSILGSRTVGETTIYTEESSYKSVYAYRQITDEELAKATMMNIAYAFYLENGGNEELKNIDSSKYKYNGDVIIDKNHSEKNIQGKAIFGERHLLGITEAGQYKADISFEDFSAKMLTPFGIYETFTSVSMTDVSTRTQGLADRYLNKFRTKDFPVTVKNSDSLISLNYDATFTVTCESSSYITIKKDGKTIISTTDPKIRKSWFPIQIDSDSNYWLKSSEYGWWED